MNIYSEDVESDDSNPFEHIETGAITIRNLATEKFLFEMEVPNSSSDLAPQANNMGLPMHVACDVDIAEMTRRQFDIAVEKCDCNIKVEEQMIDNIANELRQGLFLPQDLFGCDLEPVIFRLVPVIYLNSDLGAVVAFAVGHLMVGNINDPKKRILFKGFARDLQTQQILINSVAEFMLTSNPMDS